MITIFIIKKKKIIVNGETLVALLHEKAKKVQAAHPVAPAVCQDLVHMQVNNHTEECFSEQEVFFGKRLAAAYQGVTVQDLFGPAYPNDRRNKQHRNKLSPEEEELLHQTRLAIRNLQLQ